MLIELPSDDHYGRKKKNKQRSSSFYPPPPGWLGLIDWLYQFFFSFLFLVLQVLSFFCGLFRKMVPS